LTAGRPRANAIRAAQRPGRPCGRRRAGAIPPGRG
jgi:hypothetical protein